MKKTNGMILALAAIALLAGGGVWADDSTAAVSDEVSLDTRSVSVVAVLDDQDLDSRSFTEAWSPSNRLSTKKIVGTMIGIR